MNQEFHGDIGKMYKVQIEFEYALYQSQLNNQSTLNELKEYILSH